MKQVNMNLKKYDKSNVNDFFCQNSSNSISKHRRLLFAYCKRWFFVLKAIIWQTLLYVFNGFNTKLLHTSVSWVEQIFISIKSIYKNQIDIILFSFFENSCFRRFAQVFLASYAYCFLWNNLERNANNWTSRKSRWMRRICIIAR